MLVMDIWKKNKSESKSILEVHVTGMSLTEDKAKVFEDAGLSLAEAKVYLALAKLGQSKATTIWKNSDLPRQDIYRLLSDLQSKGFVEKIIAYPAEFRPIPIKTALSNLMKTQGLKYREVVEKTRKLLENVSQVNRPMHEGEYELTLRNFKRADYVSMTESLDGAKESVDLVDNWASFKIAVEEYAEPFLRCVIRKVKVRAIADRPPENETPSKIVRKLLKSGLFELRYLESKPKSALSIRDKKLGGISLKLVNTTPDSPMLVSDNAQIVDLFQDYFNMLWDKAALKQRE